MAISTNFTLRVERLLVYGFLLIPTTILFFMTLWQSFSWYTVVDVPMFMYSGFLMDHFHMAPVRDFFTSNMLGTHVVFRWLYHFFGSSNLGMRLADTTVLVVVLGLMGRILAPFGRRVAWAGVVLFGLLHLRSGELCYLQGDFLALVPIAFMVLYATTWFVRRARLQWFMSGLFCGVLLTIRPFMFIGGVAVFIFLLVNRDTTDALNRREWVRRGFRVAFFYCLGGSLPLVWMAGYYAYYGVLGEFARIAVDFSLLHADISSSRIPYALRMLAIGSAWGNFQLAMGSVGGAALFLFSDGFTKQERKLGYLLLSLGMAFMVYPCFAGLFYEHHYYPFRFLCSTWLAFCFRAWQGDTPMRFRVFSGLLAAYITISMFYVNVDTLLKPVDTLPISIAPPLRTERIAHWFDKRIQPGDTVQPIERGFCGIVHAMLDTGIKVPTHIIWAGGLFQHISNPFVQHLRKTFVDELAAAKPRFVIQSKMKLDYITGIDGSDKFPELESLLKRDYFVALDSDTYCIWESKASATAQEDLPHAAAAS